jgi:hypothetical protein
MFTIFDTNRNTTKKVAQIKARGITAVGRYLAYGLVGDEKHIKADEARALADAGIALFLINEIDARTAAHVATAKRDADYCRDYAHDHLGMGAGTGIYDCADFDSLAGDYPAIKARAAIFGPEIATAGYVNGLYGNGFTCGRAKKDGLIRFRWLTCSTGFDGTKEAIRANEYEMLQALPTPVEGLDTDPDSISVGVTDIGARVPFAKPPAPPAPIAPHEDHHPATLFARIKSELGL